MQVIWRATFREIDAHVFNGFNECDHLMQLCLIKGRGSVSGILFLFSVRGGFKAVQAPFWGAGWARKTAVKKCSRSFLFSVCIYICLCQSVWAQFLQAALGKNGNIRISGDQTIFKVTAGGHPSCHWWMANEEASDKSCKRTCWQFLGARMHSWNVNHSKKC